MNFNLQSKDLDPYFATNFDPLVSLLKFIAKKVRADCNPLVMEICIWCNTRYGF